MKEVYESPEFDVIRFEMEDIITSSGCNSDDDTDIDIFRVYK